MAKDPAVLLYTSDFLTGTILMNYEQKGKYITLLCIQHQHGIIDKISFDIIVGNDNMLKSKFLQNTNGFYNQRMLEETNKRKSYCESRSLNKLGKKHNKKICESYDNHMENENEDVNRDVIVNKVLNTKNIVSKKTTVFLPQQEAYNYFSEKYKINTGEDFKSDNKDFIILTSLIKKSSLEKVKQKIDFLEIGCKNDGVFWFAKDFTAFTIKQLSVHWNEILPRLTEDQKEQQEKQKIKEKMLADLEERKAKGW